MSRVSRVGVREGQCYRIRVTFSLVTGFAWDFPTWYEWNYMSGYRRVATAISRGVARVVRGTDKAPTFPLSPQRVAQKRHFAIPHV